jgi:hypothetical protein
MSLSDKIAIAAFIVSASGFTVKGTILYLKTKTDKMKTIFKNQYIRTLLVVAILSIIFAVVPWDKIHLGEEKTKIVYVPAPIKKTDSIGRNPIKVLKETVYVASKIRNIKGIKPKLIDTGKYRQQGKNNLNGNVSGGTVIVGDNGVINQREQRVFSESDYAKLTNRIEALIISNNLTRDIDVIVSYPISSEESARLAMKIGTYLHGKGYKVTSVGPSTGNENLGFVVRYISNEIQVEVGLKDVGPNKL